MKVKSCFSKWKLKLINQMIVCVMMAHITWWLLTQLCWLDVENVMEDAPFRDEQPLVQLVLLVRNKAPVLPYVLSHIHALQYPKRRIILYIRADHCHDRSIDILQDWLYHVAHEYNKTDVALDQTKHKFRGDNNPRVYSIQSYKHVIKLKEDAMTYAKDNNVDFVLLLDADVIITYSNLVDHLISQNKTIVGPLVRFSSSEYEGNIWPKLSKDLWRDTWIFDELNLTSDNEMELGYRNVKLCTKVALVHSCLLINMRKSFVEKLTFDYRKLGHTDKGGKILDDLVSFAVSAENAGIDMIVCNMENYGVVLPYTSGQTDEMFVREVEDMLVKAVNPMSSWQSDTAIGHGKTERDFHKLNIDEIYYINLDRRPERRKSMEFKFRILRLGPVKRIPAVDGRQLEDSYLIERNIKAAEGYRNTFDDSELTKGEIGCFMSHHQIWEDVVSRNLSKVLVFEDDFSFHSGFPSKVEDILSELKRLRLSWDIISLSRLGQRYEMETNVIGSNILFEADLSYWTICYMLSREGAKKLLAPRPLSKIIPVDLYFAALADKLDMDCKLEFEPRNLRFWSSSKRLGIPTHIENVDSEFFSDTVM